MKRSKTLYLDAAKKLAAGAPAGSVSLPGMFRVSHYLPTAVKDATFALKPCPFCGCKARLMSEGDPKSSAAFVECMYCGCKSPAMIRRKTTVTRWNRRTGEAS